MVIVSCDHRTPSQMTAYLKPRNDSNPGGVAEELPEGQVPVRKGLATDSGIMAYKFNPLQTQLVEMQNLGPRRANLFSAADCANHVLP